MFLEGSQFLRDGAGSWADGQWNNVAQLGPFLAVTHSFILARGGPLQTMDLAGGSPVLTIVLKCSSGTTSCRSSASPQHG